MNTEKLKVLTARFFEDPEWENVENMIMAHIEPLRDFNTIDLKQSAENVKAEVIGRMLCYNNMIAFLKETKLVNREFKPYDNPYK